MPAPHSAPLHAAHLAFEPGDDDLLYGGRAFDPLLSESDGASRGGRPVVGAGALLFQSGGSMQGGIQVDRPPQSKVYSGGVVFGAFVAGMLLATAVGAAVLSVVDLCS